MVIRRVIRLDDTNIRSKYLFRIRTLTKAVFRILLYTIVLNFTKINRVRVDTYIYTNCNYCNRYKLVSRYIFFAKWINTRMNALYIKLYLGNNVHHLPACTVIFSFGLLWPFLTTLDKLFKCQDQRIMVVMNMKDVHG